MSKVKVIAEIANAHLGDPGILVQLVDAAALAGADGIKFQWFKYDVLATPDYAYYPLYKELFIPAPVWQETLQWAKQCGLEVWVDIFDEWGLQLAEKLSSLIDGLKIPPTVLQAGKIRDGVFKLKKPVLLGVGGWYENELDDFLAGLDQEKCASLILIHGFQGYPTKTADANLVRIRYLKDRYRLPVGFADHEDGSSPLALDLPLYAVFAGATLIEKHLTLDRAQKGYDYYSALEPPVFLKMVSKLREAEAALGTVEIREAERRYLKESLRVVARREICPGEIVTFENTVLKRCPAERALLPSQLAERSPLVAKHHLHEDQPLLPENLEPLPSSPNPSP